MRQDSNHTILIVDDNSDIRRLIIRVLESAGYRVIEACSGEEALKLPDNPAPDLVLMDMRLSGKIDGLETTRRLKMDPRRAGVPVVALTANILDGDRQLAMEAGCEGLIGKPIDVVNFPHLVEEFIAVRS
jgi:CheY-like chemotaxis protein